MRLRSINPSLIRSADLDRVHLNQKLDPFDPKNGYNPTGSSTYSKKFKERYFERQAEQMNHLIDLALDRLQQTVFGVKSLPLVKTIRNLLHRRSTGTDAYDSTIFVGLSPGSRLSIAYFFRAGRSRPYSQTTLISRSTVLNSGSPV